MAEIDLTPTEEMAANAARGLELRRKHGKGGTEIGVARARDISNRKNLSPETVRRMHAFFSRHEKNKAGGEDDAGYIAWLLWGGDSGQSWAKRKVEQMNKGENQRSDTYKEIAQRLGSAAKMGKDRPLDVTKTSGSSGGTWRKVMTSYGSKKAAVLTFIDNGQVGQVYQDPDNPSVYKAFDMDGTLLGQGSEAEMKRRVEARNFSRSGAKAMMGKYVVSLKSQRTGNTIEFPVTAISEAEAKNYANAVYGDAWKVMSVAVKASRPGAKAKFGYEKSINIMLEDAQIPDHVYDWRNGVLLVDAAYHDRIVAVLKSYVPWEIKSLPKIQKVEMSRPGAKAKMQNAPWMQHVSNMLRDLTNERQRVQVWIAGPTTIKVAGMWMAYTRYGKGAAIASRMAYYLTQAAGTPGKYSGQDIKDSPRKGTNTTIWTVSNVPEDAVSYLKAWGIGTSPKAFAGFTGESAVSYARPGAKAKFAQPPFSASDLNALKRLVKQYEKLGKESAGELDRAHHHKALAIASTLHEIIDFAASGKTGRAYAQVRISTPEFQKLLPASLVKAAYDVTKSDTYSRPGAKARMSKEWQTIERYLEVLDTEFGEPRGKAAAQEMMRAAAAIGGDEGARLKAAINTMATSRDYNARQRAYNAIASMMPFSRPGAKATMGASRLYVLAYEGRTPHRIPVQSISEGIEILKQNPSAAASLIHESDIGKRTTIAYGTKTGRANWTEAGIEVSRKMSRPGAKSKMARDLKVRKGNFTDAVAIVGQNGGGSASFYAGLILRHKDGEEQVLWMKHGYSTEKAAERAALQRFDAHVSRMSRPGAKDANAVREGEKVSASDDAVSRKIRKLMDEGKPQKQAVAIALDLERRGEL